MKDGGPRGLTLRDYFAAAALQGMLASTEEGCDYHVGKAIAAWAYDYADAMLAERKKLAADPAPQ